MTMESDVRSFMIQTSHGATYNHDSLGSGNGYALAQL